MVHDACRTDANKSYKALNAEDSQRHSEHQDRHKRYDIKWKGSAIHEELRSVGEDIE
jgi:hypothetical protein